jgi:hypothetical protein
MGQLLIHPLESLKEKIGIKDINLDMAGLETFLNPVPLSQRAYVFNYKLPLQFGDRISIIPSKLSLNFKTIY